MLVLAANLFVVVVGAICLYRAHRELNQSGRRSVFTASLVWVAYLAHTGTTAWAAWGSVWPLPMDRFAARSIGGGLFAIGLLILAAGMIEFRSLARMSGRSPDRLVRSGIYRWTRNPQNVGWGLALLGIAVFGRSAAALLLAAEFWAVFRLYIPWEERFLASFYGEEWEDYSDTAPRFLGVPQDLMGAPLSLDIFERDAEPSASDPAEAQ